MHAILALGPQTAGSAQRIQPIWSVVQKNIEMEGDRFPAGENSTFRITVQICSDYYGGL